MQNYQQPVNVIVAKVFSLRQQSKLMNKKIGVAAASLRSESCQNDTKYNDQLRTKLRLWL